MIEDLQILKHQLQTVNIRIHGTEEDIRNKSKDLKSFYGRRLILEAKIAELKKRRS